VDPLSPKLPHFAPKAKRVVYMFQAGAPSHLELYDPKPELTKHDGKLPPADLLKGYRAAFINPKSALLGPKYGFQKYGASGIEMSDLLPYTGAIADDIVGARNAEIEHRGADHIEARLGAGQAEQRGIGATGLGGQPLEAGGAGEIRPMRRSQPGHPAAFLVHQDRRLGVEFRAEVSDQRAELAGIDDIAAEKNNTERPLGAQQRRLISGQDRPGNPDDRRARPHPNLYPRPKLAQFAAAPESPPVFNAPASATLGHAAGALGLHDVAERLGRRDIVPNINWFMRVPVNADGSAAIALGVSPPGCQVALRAEMDALVVISNCPQVNNPCNNFNPTPIRVQIQD
jgi:hypothetical protein